MRCLRKFYSWLYLLWQLSDAVHVILPYGKNQIGELPKEEKHVIGGLVEQPTARIDTETESIRYMWHGKDKMDDNGLKAMKYEGRSFPYKGM